MSDERVFGGGFRLGALREVAVGCTDAAAAARFYAEALGLEPVAAPEGRAAFRLADDCRLTLLAAEGPAAPARLALAVTPHDQARAADWFRRLGLASRFEAAEGGGRALVASGPGGAAVALVVAEAGA